MVGETFSADFPTTPGAFQLVPGGSSDAFITKLNAAGSALVYSTYLGGTSSDTGYGIAVDSGGNAYVTGETVSVNFPTTPGAFQTIYGGGLRDAFITKLNAAGSALVYSTYLGGSGIDRGFGIAVDSDGNAYVTGQTGSGDFPTTPGAFQTVYGGNIDAFITKLDTTGSALVYSTYLGGSGTDRGLGIAIDGDGNAYVTGETASVNFPTTLGTFQTTIGGGFDAFIAKLAIGTPTVTGLFPDSGPEAGGTVVTITGTNFTDIFAVTFGASPAASFVVDSNTQITAVFPPGTGTVDVTVTAPGGTSPLSPAGEFTYISPIVATQTVLTASPNPSITGQAVTLTAAVNPSSATGIVGFFDGNTLIGSAPLVNGTAALAVNSLAAGSHTLTAVYGGNEIFSPSASPAVLVIVNPLLPVMVLPPAHLKGSRQANRFLSQTDYANILTWKFPKQGAVPVAYQIYRNSLTNLIASVPSFERLRYEDHNLAMHLFQLSSL